MMLAILQQLGTSKVNSSPDRSIRSLKLPIVIDLKWSALQKGQKRANQEATQSTNKSIRGPDNGHIRNTCNNNGGYYSGEINDKFKNFDTVQEYIKMKI